MLYIYRGSSPHQWLTHVTSFEMPSFSAFYDSVRCCCRTRRSCWMSSFIECLQWVVLYQVLLTVRSEVVRLWGDQNMHFFDLQVPGIDIAMDWLIQHPTDQYTQQKCRKYIHLCLRLFCPIYVSFLRITFVNLPPIRNSYTGSHGTHSPPFPTTVRAFVLIERTINVQNQVSSPGRPLASNWCAFIQPTSVIRSTQAARRFLWSICILMLLFQA